jgi:hypothetical protein
MDNVADDLRVSAAPISGSSTSDQLSNIVIVQASGSQDGLLGGAGATTLTARGSADRLIGGSSTTTLAGDVLSSARGRRLLTIWVTTSPSALRPAAVGSDGICPASFVPNSMRLPEPSREPALF